MDHQAKSFLVAVVILSVSSVVSPARVSDASPSPDHRLKVTIHPSGPSAAIRQASVSTLLQEPALLEKIGGAGYRVVSAKSSISDGASPRALDVLIHNYSTNKSYRVQGEPGSSDGSQTNPPQVTELSQQPFPSEDEFKEAVEIAKADPGVAAILQDHLVHWYKPMPPLVASDNGARILSVGLITQNFDGTDEANEVLGVDVSCRSVIRFPEGAPPTSRAVGSRCGAPDGSGNESQGDGSAEITVDKDGVRLWDLQVIRPHVSSGVFGSGVELVNVYYRGKKVFARAHVPILNVKYDGDVCGPYRDWVNEESSFQAQGNLLADGILEASSKPTTIHDSGSDFGDFNGVAVYTDGPEVMIVSELAAGWYRYRSEWRLNEDGTIKPVFAFSSVQNSCVCHIHHHHVYWRFDFDIEDGNRNQVWVGNTRKTHLIKKETVMYRGGPAWRAKIINSDSKSGYMIVPGAHDGTAAVKKGYTMDQIADAKYAKGDFWVLQYDPDQIDDSKVVSTKAAGLDRFIKHRPVADKNIVVWYGAHFLHDVHAHPAHENSGGIPGDPDTHFLGPTLVPQ